MQLLLIILHENLGLRSAPPTSVTSRRYTFYGEHSPYLCEAFVKGRRVQQAYYYRLYFVHNFSLFISEGKEIILRVEGTDTLHQ